VQRAMELLEETVRKEIEPVIAGMGFTLVEARVIKTRTSATVRVIIFGERGTGIGDCESVSRQIYPKLELVEDLGAFSLEVSSPGIGRELKSTKEYGIFHGQGLSVLLTGESEWRKGVIEGIEGESLVLKLKDEMVTLPFHEIKRAKLAFIE
jgi:ribosome maturation factor RimP